MNTIDEVDVLEQEEEKKKNPLGLIIKILLIILLLLFLLSTLVLVIRIGDFLPNNTNIIFIEPKDPEYEASDDKQVWDVDTEIDIFEISSKNGEGVITVMSGNGDNVIAPGMDGYYKFNVKNKGNMAIDYSCVIKVWFETNIEDLNITEIPIVIKLMDHEGNYVIGNEDTWSDVENLEDFVDDGVLGKNCYAYYTLYWMWAYESGNDEFDTYLGNLSSTNSIKLVLKIETKAEQSTDKNAVGGLPSGGDDPRTGGNIVPLPYIILNLLILLIIIALILLPKIFKKEEEPEPEIIIPSIPDPEVEPVIPVEPEEIKIVEEVSTFEVNNLMTDDTAYSNIERSKRVIDKTKTGIINIDVISTYFDNGDVVTLEAMKEKIPGFKKNITYVKVLARGTLNKALTVEADDFSVEAVKMILLTGGRVVCSKVK